MSSNSNTNPPAPVIYKDPATFINPAAVEIDSDRKDQVQGNKSQEENLYSASSAFSGLPTPPTHNPTQKVQQSDTTFIQPASTHQPVADLSGPPPALGTPRLHSEPSGQWAAQTLDAISHDAPLSHTQDANPTASTATTPGIPMPGAFPHVPPGPTVVQADMEKAKEVAATVIQTAKEYVGVAAEKVAPLVGAAAETAKGYAGAATETAKGYAGTAAETTKGYVGAAVDTTKSSAGAASETTKEYAGAATEATKGYAGAAVDTTKGYAGAATDTTKGYAGAATDTTKEYAGATTQATKGYAGAASDTVMGYAGAATQTARNIAGTVGEKVAPYLPQSVAGYVKPAAAPQPSTPFGGEDAIAQLPEERRTAGFPSHDDESFTPLGKSAGVGALPGTANESSVALLPDERNEGSRSGSTAATAKHIPSTAVTAKRDHDVADRDDTVTKVLGERRQDAFSSNDNGSSPLGHSGGVGRLPGDSGESGVAVLPNEREKSSTEGKGLNMGTYLNPRFDIKPDTSRDHHHQGGEVQGTKVPERNVPQPSNNTQLDNHHLQFKDTSDFVPQPTFTSTTNPEPKPSVAGTAPGAPSSSLAAGLTGLGALGQGVGGGNDGGMSQDASTNASIKSLAGSKHKDASDHAGAGAGLETLREHTADAPRSGSAGVYVAPAQDAKVPPTKAGDRPPPVPEKALPEKMDSDRATIGHGDNQPVTTTTNKIGHGSPAHAAGTSPTNNNPSTQTPIHAARAVHTQPGTTTNIPSSLGDTSQTRFKDETAGDKLGSSSTGSPPKKAGFMDKLKGEAKIISGKIGKDEEKVLEGRRMMGKN